jgi:hypothetical protein
MSDISIINEISEEIDELPRKSKKVNEQENMQNQDFNKKDIKYNSDDSSIMFYNSSDVTIEKTGDKKLEMKNIKSAESDSYEEHTISDKEIISFTIAETNENDQIKVSTTSNNSPTINK